MKANKLTVALALFLSAAAAGQSTGADWKEYAYAADNFALSAPYRPDPHADAAFENATAYTVNLPATNEGVTLRVLHDPHDCATYLAELKKGIAAGKWPGADLSSVKDISINGHPGMQYEWRVNPTRVIQERYYCVNNRFYIFFVDHPMNRSLSAQMRRLLASFRLTTTSTQK